MAFYRCLALIAMLACLLLTAPSPSTAGHHNHGNNQGLETLLVTGVLAKVLEKKGGGEKHPKIIPVFVPVGGGHHHHHHQKSYGSESHYGPESRMPHMGHPMPLPHQPMMPGLQEAANQILFNQAMQQERMNTMGRAHALAQSSNLAPGVDISEFQPRDKVMVFNINV